MPRPPKQKLDFTMNSVKNHLQEIYNQLEELRVRAVRDYNRAIDFILPNNPGDDDEAASMARNTLEQMETARNNAMKSFENFFTKKTDLLKLHAGITQALSKSLTATEKSSATSWDEDAKLEVQKMYRDLKEMNISPPKV